jgi:hypothetical protein
VKVLGIWGDGVTLSSGRPTVVTAHTSCNLRMSHESANCQILTVD